MEPMDDVGEVDFPFDASEWMVIDDFEDEIENPAEDSADQENEKAHEKVSTGATVKSTSKEKGKAKNTHQKKGQNTGDGKPSKTSKLSTQKKANLDKKTDEMSASVTDTAIAFSVESVSLQKNISTPSKRLLKKSVSKEPASQSPMSAKLSRVSRAENSHSATNSPKPVKSLAKGSTSSPVVALNKNNTPTKAAKKTEIGDGIGATTRSAKANQKRLKTATTGPKSGMATRKADWSLNTPASKVGVDKPSTRTQKSIKHAQPTAQSSKSAPSETLEESVQTSKQCIDTAVVESLSYDVVRESFAKNAEVKEDLQSTVSVKTDPETTAVESLSESKALRESPANKAVVKQDLRSADFVKTQPETKVVESCSASSDLRENPANDTEGKQDSQSMGSRESTVKCAEEKEVLQQSTDSVKTELVRKPEDQHVAGESDEPADQKYDEMSLSEIPEEDVSKGNDHGIQDSLAELMSSDCVEEVEGYPDPMSYDDIEDISDTELPPDVGIRKSNVQKPQQSFHKSLTPISSDSCDNEEISSCSDNGGGVSHSGLKRSLSREGSRPSEKRLRLSEGAFSDAMRPSRTKGRDASSECMRPALSRGEGIYNESMRPSVNRVAIQDGSSQTSPPDRSGKLVQCKMERQKASVATQVGLTEQTPALPEYNLSKELFSHVTAFHNFTQRQSAVCTHGISFGPVLASDVDKASFRDETLKKADSFNISFTKRDIGLVELFFEQQASFHAMLVQMRRMRIGSRYLVVTYCKQVQDKCCKVTIVYDQHFASTAFLTYYKAPFWSKPKTEQTLCLHNVPGGIPLEFLKALLPDAISVEDEDKSESSKEGSRILISLNHRMGCEAITSLFCKMYVCGCPVVYSKGILRTREVPEMKGILAELKKEKCDVEFVAREVVARPRDINPARQVDEQDVRVEVEEVMSQGTKPMEQMDRMVKAGPWLADPALSDVSDDLSDISDGPIEPMPRKNPKVLAHRYSRTSKPVRMSGSQSSESGRSGKRWSPEHRHKPSQPSRPTQPSRPHPPHRPKPQENVPGIIARDLLRKERLELERENMERQERNKRWDMGKKGREGEHKTQSHKPIRRRSTSPSRPPPQHSATRGREAVRVRRSQSPQPRSVDGKGTRSSPIVIGEDLRSGMWLSPQQTRGLDVGPSTSNQPPNRPAPVDRQTVAKFVDQLLTLTKDAPSPAKSAEILCKFLPGLQEKVEEVKRAGGGPPTVPPLDKMSPADFSAGRAGQFTGGNNSVPQHSCETPGSQAGLRANHGDLPPPIPPPVAPPIQSQPSVSMPQLEALASQLATDLQHHSPRTWTTPPPSAPTHHPAPRHPSQHPAPLPMVTMAVPLPPHMAPQPTHMPPHMGLQQPPIAPPPGYTWAPRQNFF